MQYVSTRDPQHVRVGDTASVDLHARECNGARPMRGPFRYASSDTAVAAVDPANGRVVARRAGTATVTAEGGGLHESVRFIVRDAR